MRAGDEATRARVAQLEARAGQVTQLSTRMEGLERELAALRQEFDAKVARLENLVAFAVPVHFDFGQHDVRERDRAVLDRFASVIREYYPGAVLTIEGFTDPSGGTGHNLRLGKRRAESVKAYLANEGGIDADRIRTVSYGEMPSRLVDNRGGPDAGARNRRVVLVIDARGNAAAPSEDAQR
jgi:peptidoglycan-associated lipoprotein